MHVIGLHRRVIVVIARRDQAESSSEQRPIRHWIEPVRQDFSGESREREHAADRRFPVPHDGLSYFNTSQIPSAAAINGNFDATPPAGAGAAAVLVMSTALDGAAVRSTDMPVETFDPLDRPGNASGLPALVVAAGRVDVPGALPAMNGART